MKKVLVTGAAGFIGLNVVKAYVEHGWFVYALVHNNVPKELTQLKNVELLRGDVVNSKLFEGLQVDVVAHVAGIASDIGDDLKFRKINYEPIKYLAKLPKEKIVYVSSSDVYGIKDFQKADENTPRVEFPKNPYPRYKIKSEEWLEKNPYNYVIIRPAAVYGEGDKTLENRVVEFLKFSPFIVHFGKWKGKNRWPLANVKNVANTIVAVSMTSEFDKQAITIIDPVKTTIDEYYHTIAKKYFPNRKYINLNLPFWFGKFLGFISTTLSNLFKLKAPLFDPTFYAVHHVSSNLDFSSEKMEMALKSLDKNKELLS